MKKHEPKPSGLADHMDKVLHMHREQVANSRKLEKTTKHSFNQHQALFFDAQADWYISPEATPHEVKLNLSRMFKLLSEMCHPSTLNEIKVLDVGCGSGVLIPFITETFQHPTIHAIDLSKNMLSNLKHKFPEVETHLGDIADFNAEHGFDLIFCNACFGNFYSQQEALATMSSLLQPHGFIAISHPLGAHFVTKLHEQDASTVPHQLPVKEDEILELCNLNGLTVSHIIQEDHFYLLLLQKDCQIDH